MVTDALPMKPVCQILLANMSSTLTSISSICCASAACCWANKLSSLLSLLLAFQDADHLRAVEQFFIRIDELRGKALHAIKTVKMDSVVGRKSNQRNGRIAARLGDFASTQLGRAASGFLFKGWRSNSRRENYSEARRSRRATRFKTFGLS